jgi:hypothetical protein
MAIAGHAWWELKGDECARCLYDEVKAITAKDNPRLTALQRYNQLYTGRDNVVVSTYDLVTRLRLISDVQRIVEGKLRYNVVQSAINTLHSKICKRKERVRLLTSGGSWDERRNAQRGDRMLYGLFMSARVHEQNMKQTLDSYWAGSGFVQVGHKIRNGKIEMCVQRIHPAEVVVDFEDSEDGEPKTMRRIKAVPVESLIKAYPNLKDRIELLQVNRQGLMSSYDSLTRRVLVIEAWHLPQDDGTGGRHVLAIENAILEEEDYTEFDFPIIKQDYQWAPIGYYGIGIAEMIAGHQAELDGLLGYRQECLKRGSNPRTYVEKGSLVNKDQLTNDPNAIVEYAGTMPQQEVRPPYADQLYRDIEDIYQKAFREVGISELASASVKPAGLNSGKALREFSDIESERFQTAGQNRQNAHVDIARALVREVKRVNELAKHLPEYRAAQRKVMSYDREYGLETFELKDIEMLTNEYIIQPHNVSMFPQKPEGQLEFAQELAQAGIIDPGDTLELLDFPDTSALINMRLAGGRFSRKVVETMLDTGEYISPDPYEDHARNFQVARMYYDQGKLSDLDEARMDLLRRYLDDNDRFLKMATEAAQAPAADALPPDQMPLDQMPPEMMGALPETALLEQPMM